MAADSKILVILGPTASGKSDVAMEIARQTGSEILSVDSMQVYRGMDIGTAKPGLEEQRQVLHHLIDLLDPNEVFTAARFVESADRVIDDAAARHVPLVATGGTPLYYKSLFQGLFEGPSADAAIRARLAGEGNEQLFKRLSAVDPAAAGRIHQNDTRRVIRALEVYELTGQPISSFQTEWEAAEVRHPATWVGLNWDREALNRRINSRTRQMIDAGWLAETRGLVARYGQLSTTAAEATGYSELLAHLAGRCSLDDACEEIKIATRQLARRQMKWLRRFPDVLWIEGNRSPEVLAEEIIRHWRARSGGV